MEAWTKALGVQPRKGSKVEILRLASLYEELRHTEGWRDFITLVTNYKTQLSNDLLTGKFSGSREPGVTDNEIRAMLFVINRILAIPTEIDLRYEMWKQQNDLLRTMETKIASRNET